MSGVRVSGLQANVTDKHLKVYFSNPRNGGGRILKIYHPLPHASAVVIFDDKRVVQELLKKNHQISGKPVDISATPKQVFRRAIVEIEKNVSDFLSVNPQLVDELQFIGEVSVKFQYEKQRYLLDGAWYQIEWALHYLDTMLEAFQFDMGTEFESHGHVRNTRNRAMAAERRSPTEFREESPPRTKEIKRPNIPVVRQLQQDEQPKSLPVTTGNQVPNFRQFTDNHSREMEDILPKANKNKNVMPVTSSESRPIESKLYGRTVRSNLDDGKQDRYNTASWNQGRSNDKKQDRYHTASSNQGGTRQESGGAKYFSNDDDEDWEPGRNRGAQSSYKKTFEGQDDSDSENEASLAAAYDRRVAFSGDTNFDENKGRPQRIGPRMTKGIDVSKTDFGEAPLSFAFEIPGNLRVNVAMDDVTMQTTDAIINPTTPDLTNVYGVSRAILAAAGYEMQMECRRYAEEKGPLPYAGAMHTAAGGSLSQKIGFVIHTAGPSWSEEESEYCTHLLVCTYINCFQYADQKLWVQSLATPLISAGTFGFPLDVCIGAFYDALLLFSTRTSARRHMKEIHLVCFDQDSAMATIMIVQSLLDCDSAQSAVAATDRYWMRSSKYNFQAENFGKADGEKNGSDDEQSDDETRRDVNKVVRGKRSVQATRDDENRQSDSEDNDTDKFNEKSNVAQGKQAGKQAAKNKNFTTEHEKSDFKDDSGSETEEVLNPYVDVNIAEGKPETVAAPSSFYQKLGLKHDGKDDKDCSNSDESYDDDGLKGKKETSDSNVDVNMAIGESGKIESGSSYTKKLDLANVDKDDDSSDDNENSNVQEQEPIQICGDSEPEGEHLETGDTKAKEAELETGDTKAEEAEEDKTGYESRDEMKPSFSDRSDKEEEFKVTVGKSSLADDTEWSMVSGNDVAKDVNMSNDHESGDETGEKLYL